ncbi:hypothetical protein LCGC14_2549790 [marine sediment metagenome]|uniref:Uncharacterized protein n=1 Tax=marine sediment metagenome TaxID=412755 RepID=A0A0F9AN32_9ZZZZ
MDISKEYILQCSKAEKIQKGWKPQTLDVIFAVGEGNILYVSDNPLYWTHYRGIKEHQIIKDPDGRKTAAEVWYKATWLPRQDQLQDLVKDKYLKYAKKSMFKYHEILLYHINSFSDEIRCSQIKGHGYCYDNSMEQLWLAFVMKEKYQKQWNGTDWVK